jgi:hypothetical protein
VAYSDKLIAPVSPGTLLNITPSAASWANGTWTQLLASAATDIELVGWRIASQLGSSATMDSTYEIEIDFGIGGSGSEVVVATFPYTIRQDDNTGHFVDYTNVGFFPEPFTVASGTRIAVRARASSITNLNIIAPSIRYQIAKVTAASSATITFTATTNGVVSTPGGATHFGASSATITFTGTTAATRKTFGVSTGRVTFTGTTAATRKTFGVSTGRITFTATTAAYKKTFGASTGTIVFGATTNGIIAGGAVTYFGASVGRITFTATTSQRIKAVASSQGRVTFTATTGQRVKAVASSQGRVTFTGTTAAYKRTFATSAGRVTFTATSNGVNLGTPPAIVPASLTVTDTAAVTLTVADTTVATATVQDAAGATLTVVDVVP